MRRHRLVTILIALAVVTPLPALAAPIWTGILGTEAAVGGYDSVSYFAGTPVLGSDAFTTQYKGATFKFANAKNMATFKADPARYAPQYGGHCAWAAGNNYRFAGDPKVWKIVNRKLYLNYNRSVQEKWEKDTPGLIAKGDANWVTLGQ